MASAAFSVSSRAISISQKLFATSCRMLDWSASFFPKATRLSARRAMISSARCA